MELVGIIILSLLLVPVVVLTHGALRIFLGVLFLLFFPGYALLAALFPRKDSLDPFERVALSFVLSIAVVPLLGLILNYTPGGITLYPIIISIASFILINSVIGLYRRHQLPQEQKFEFRPSIKIKLPQWKQQGRLDKALTVVLVFSVIVAIGVLVYVVASPKTPEKFSEFYILGSEGMAANYPRSLVLGESTAVTLGIINKEHQDTVYQVAVTIDGEKVQDIGPVNLAHKGKWESMVTITPNKAGTNQKVEFLLYKGERSEPYLTLRLWLDVQEKK